MSIEEIYQRLGGDYGDVLRRMGKAERVIRFLSIFPDDPSFLRLSEALKSGDVEEAFRSAHSLKGICMNLGLTRLRDSSGALTETLRGGQITEDSLSLFRQVQEDYTTTVDYIRQLP